MKSLLFASVAALGLLTTSPATAQEPANYKAARALLDATVQLNGNCSGQLIYSQREPVSGEVTTLVLTAKHCVGATGKPGETQLVSLFDLDKRLSVVGERRYPADVIGRDAATDVALLRLRDRNTLFTNTIKIEDPTAELFVTEPVIAVGYPLGWSLTFTPGVLGPRERSTVTGSEHVYQRATPDIAGGSSGGGLYHVSADGSYKLIGIATAGVRGNSFVGLYTTVEDIAGYLAKVTP